ncbi:MAG: CopG family transcriptional regulator [Burkholderiales bacterium]|nr:CopG family transcriptional regulator [Burkholderiales bacterium]
MKNVTVTMEDSVADWARMEAARRNTSVSRLIGEMLAEKMRHDDAYERAMREALEFRAWGPSSGPYLSDEEMYDRGGPRT